MVQISVFCSKLLFIFASNEFTNVLRDAERNVTTMNDYFSRIHFEISDILFRGK